MNKKIFYSLVLLIIISIIFTPITALIFKNIPNINLETIFMTGWGMACLFFAFFILIIMSSGGKLHND